MTPENEKSKEGFGGGLAIDGGHLYAATGYGTVVSLDASNGCGFVDEADWQADPQLADRRRRQDLFRLDRQYRFMR